MRTPGTLQSKSRALQGRYIQTVRLRLSPFQGLNELDKPDPGVTHYAALRAHHLATFSHRFAVNSEFLLKKRKVIGFLQRDCFWISTLTRKPPPSGLGRRVRFQPSRREAKVGPFGGILLLKFFDYLSDGAKAIDAAELFFEAFLTQSISYHSACFDHLHVNSGRCQVVC